MFIQDSDSKHSSLDPYLVMETNNEKNQSSRKLFIPSTMTIVLYHSHLKQKRLTTNSSSNQPHSSVQDPLLQKTHPSVKTMISTPILLRLQLNTRQSGRLYLLISSLNSFPSWLIAMFIPQQLLDLHFLLYLQSKC